MAWQGRERVLRWPCEVIIGPRGIMELVKPRLLYQHGTHLRGEQWSPQELCQGIGKDEVEVMEIF
jgi:hypothetical protein